MSLNDRLGAFVHEPNTIQISAHVADRAYHAINMIVEGRELDDDDRERIEDLADAMHWGFMGYGVLGGDLNAPWLVKCRLLRRRITQHL